MIAHFFLALNNISSSGYNTAYSSIHLLKDTLVSLLLGVFWASQVGHSGKESACQCKRYKRRGFYPQVGKIPWKKKGTPLQHFLPGKSHGQRSLSGYSPWGHKRVGHNLVTKRQQHLSSLLCSRNLCSFINPCCLE